MFKISLNPLVAHLSQTHRKRSASPSLLKAICGDGLERLCAWCAVGKLGKNKIQKYCSDQCRFSVMAWGYPQSEEGLAVLLARQGYKCLICQYDWNPLADSLLGKYGILKLLDRLTTFSHKLVKILKNRSPDGTKPEVDHIIPISKGGQSIGLDNHQAICTQCHKVKTKVDNSGPRKKH